jgi:hypothetical protein
MDAEKGRSPKGALRHTWKERSDGVHERSAQKCRLHKSEKRGRETNRKGRRIIIMIMSRREIDEQDIL